MCPMRERGAGGEMWEDTGGRPAAEKETAGVANQEVWQRGGEKHRWQTGSLDMTECLSSEIGVSCDTKKPRRRIMSFF